MDCAECVHLLAECERLNEAYTSAFATMIEQCRTMPGADFTMLKLATDNAWFDWERARLKHQTHEWKHVGNERSRAAHS
jgi:hypothetical protein